MALKPYPLKFHPILKDKIWGGSKLPNVLGKKAGDACGESWELSGLEGDTSLVSTGIYKDQSLNQLIGQLGADLMGQRIWEQFGGSFPLLIKFIDANADLSIQVHPNDEQSGGHGKTECWYMMQADEGATLLSGFNQEVDERTLRDSIESGTFEQYMNRVPVKVGDFFIIEANQVHTIGKGILLAEIQQPSDITYRIYDFDRTDDSGQKRELHVEEAFSVMNTSTKTGKVEYEHGEAATLAMRPEFNVERLHLTNDRSIVPMDSFQVLMAVDGDIEIHMSDALTRLKFGETCLIPANVQFIVSGKNSTVLRVYL